MNLSSRMAVARRRTYFRGGFDNDTVTRSASAAVHPGGIRTELARHMDASRIQNRSLDELAQQQRR